MSLQKDVDRVNLPKKEVLFQGKSVVITGGASGIGHALVEQFQNLGAQVLVVDISAGDQLPENVSFLQVSVADKVGLESKPSLGNIDLLIIAAGVTSETNNPTQKEQATMHAVNVVGVQNTLDVLGSLLGPEAQLVFIGSDNPPKVYYSETKKLGAQLVRDFAQENKHIDTRIVLLGPVRTKLFEKGKSPEDIRRIEGNVGLYEPDEFANELIERLAQRSESQAGLQEIVMYKTITNG